MISTRTRITSTLLAMAVVLASSAEAKDEWSKPYPNVKVLKREIPTEDDLVIRFHAAIIDLAHPGTKVVVSPPKFRGYRTSKFAKEFGAQVALNGGFWKLVSKRPIGHVVSAGRPWDDVFLDDRWGYLAVTKEGKAWIQPPGDNPRPPVNKGWMVIPGMPMIVAEGEIGKVRGCGYVCMEHPRSAAGVSEDGMTLYLVVSEGRVEGTKSIKPKELAEFMIELGAHEAIHLDGGGSSSLYVEALGGMLNAPAEGKERSVINHLGIVLGEADEPPVQDTPPEDTPAEKIDSPAVPSEAVEFSEDDFVPRQQVENPTRVKQVALYGGVAAIAIVIVGALGAAIVHRRKKNKKT